MNILQAVVAATKAARTTGVAHIVHTGGTAGNGITVRRADQLFACAPFEYPRYTCYADGTRYRH